MSLEYRKGIFSLQPGDVVCSILVGHHNAKPLLQFLRLQQKIHLEYQHAVWSCCNGNIFVILNMKIYLKITLSKWQPLFLAATKQLYEWFSPSVCLSVRLSVRLSVCPSVRPSHLFDYVPINVSSWNFQKLLPVTEVTSKQKMEVRGQRSRSQRSRPNLTISGL